MHKTLFKCIFVLIISVLSGNVLLAQIFDDDTLIIGTVEGYPSFQVMVSVYLKTIHGFQGWQMPFEFFNTDSCDPLRCDSVSYVGTVMDSFWFQADFVNNHEWDNKHACGAAGVYAQSADSLDAGYYLVMKLFFTIKGNASPDTILIDSTTASWTPGGPQNSFMVTWHGESWETRVRTGAVIVKGKTFEEDTLIIGGKRHYYVYPGDQLQIPVFSNNEHYYQGWQVSNRWGDTVDPAPMVQDSVGWARSVMYGDSFPYEWEWKMRDFDNPTQECNSSGIVWFAGSHPPATLPPFPANGDTGWVVHDMFLTADNDAPEYTADLDTSGGYLGYGGPPIKYIVTVNGYSFRTEVKQCTIHIAKDTLIIGDVICYPGDTVRVPVYLSHPISPGNSWNIPINFGDGSAPLTCDSMAINTGEWNWFFVSTFQVDNVTQNCCYGGAGFGNNQGYHKVMEICLRIDSDATPQTITVDTTTFYGSLLLNGSRVPHVRPGSIQIRGMLSGDSLKVTDRFIHPGQSVSVPINLSISVPVTGWEMPFSYGDGDDGLVLDSISFVGAWDMDYVNTEIDIVNQKCLIEGNVSPDNPPGDYLVGTLWFTGTAPGTYWIDTTTFDFGTKEIKTYGINSNSVWYMTRVKRGYLMVVIGVEEEKAGGAITIEGIYPTIARSGSDIRIAYIMPMDAETKISMYDVVGRKISTIYQGKPEYGIINTSYNTRDLAAGVYYVVVEGPDKSIRKKIVICNR